MKIIIAVFISTLLYGKSTERDRYLATMLREQLENMHYGRKKIDDRLSKNAFKLLIKRLDYSKQFLIQSDVADLKKFETKLDDAFIYGDFKVLDKTQAIYKKRIKEVKKLVFTLLKSNFNFNKKEFLETDPEKREFSKNLAERKNLWRKILKNSVLNRYLSLKEEQIEEQKAKKKEDKKDKKKKKEKPKKLLSDKELKKKASESVRKTYQRIFLRLENQDHHDELERLFNSIAMSFDPHTNYLPPQKKEDFDIEMRGTLEGIGALLQEDGEYIKVVRIIPGSASYRQKSLKPEDIILKVGQGKHETVDIVNMRIRDAVRLIRGPKNTEVRLTVKHPDGSIEIIPIVRDVVQIEDTYAQGVIIERKKWPFRFGYVHLPKFYRDFEASGRGETGRNSTDDVRKELEKFNKERVDGVILDLRNNGGGALEDAKLVSGLFIKKGPIVQVRQSEDQTSILKDYDPRVTYRGPLVVMLNRFSASASEIVAGALQDYGRAIIIGGAHSHGKGTVQVFLNLDRGLSLFTKKYAPLGALKVTIQKFYRISGASTQFKGVTPDIVLPDTFEFLESGEKFLDYALPWDEVPPLKFNRWTARKWNAITLRNNSKKRIQKDTKFKKILESIEILKERKEKTNISLRLQTVLEEKKKHKERSERLKTDELYEHIVIKGLDKTKDQDKDKIEELSKDPYINESLAILRDIILAQRK